MEANRRRQISLDFKRRKRRETGGERKRIRRMKRIMEKKE